MALRGVPHRIRLGMQSDPARTRDAQVADTAGADTSDAPPPSRIQRLAALRNVALEPMLTHAATDGPRFHRIVFLNDVCSGFLKFNTCLQGEEAVLHQTLSISQITVPNTGPCGHTSFYNRMYGYESPLPPSPPSVLENLIRWCSATATRCAFWCARCTAPRHRARSTHIS